jgi:hypothetical protein
VKLYSGLAAALCAGIVVVPASAGITFSFAADSDDSGFTYSGTNSSPAPPINLLSDSVGDPVIVDLIVDVNGAAPGGSTTFNTIFDFSGMTSSYSAIPFAGGFVHHWAMGGSFTFTQTGSGLEVLRIDFGNALFSSISNSMTALGGSASLQTSEGLDGSLNFIAGSPLAGLGITNEDLDANESFSFGLSDLHAAGANPSAPLTIGAGGSWLQSWLADASFTAGAGAAVPSPGAIVLLLLSGLVTRRGRRRVAA